MKTRRSQKSKAVEDVVPGELETPVAENNQYEDLVACPSKYHRVHSECLGEKKVSEDKPHLRSP